MIKRVLLRTDGGPGIGLGHLNRCLSLAAALQRFDTLPFFAVYGDDSALERTRERGFASSKLLDPASVEEALQVCSAYECDAIVVDSYLIAAPYLNELRAAGLLVVALDDLNAYAFGCQMVVSHGPHAPKAGYRSSSGDTQFLLGPRYTILRPEFWESALPTLDERVRNILISTGGADPNGYLPSWIELVDSIDAELSITAIIGPFFQNVSEVHDAAATTEHVCRVINAPAVMRPLLAAADIALVAGGQTTYETCALGIPTVAVEIASNQRPQLEGFRDAGAMLVAEIDDRSSIVSAVSGLIESYEARARLSGTARALVNRAGALDVARSIVGLDR
ncbi:MAG: UDP-2,4-diacetamido-2,4,6-trideoxy-beta-L-altropyranose hydrolase [Actinomycetota bacterium]